MQLVAMIEMGQFMSDDSDQGGFVFGEVQHASIENQSPPWKRTSIGFLGIVLWVSIVINQSI
jgi:hypothetical protein